jgi:hypothetical protein
VSLCTSLLGQGHAATACALTDLAAVLREQVRPCRRKWPITWFRPTLASLPPCPLLSQGKFEEAESYAAKAVESLRTGVGADDVSTATALYNLAGLAKRLVRTPADQLLPPVIYRTPPAPTCPPYLARRASTASPRSRTLMRCASSACALVMGKARPQTRSTRWAASSASSETMCAPPSTSRRYVLIFSALS